jgi:hypothetical protein
MHLQTLTLFWDNQQVAICRDIHLEIEYPPPIDYSIDGHFDMAVRSPSTYRIRAEGIEWYGNIGDIMTSAIALIARIETDG